MKTSWKQDWPQWMILAAMFSLAVWRWPLTGDKVPVHWNASGQIDRYGGRFEGLLFLPLLSLGLYGFLLLLPRFDPGRANYTQFIKAYTIIRTSILLLMFAIYSATMLLTAGYKIDVPTVIWISTGVLFIVLGGAMGKTRPNWFVGIRTPWTLSSKTAWSKTHRAGGWTFIVIGVLQIVAALTLPPTQSVWVLMPLIMIGSTGLSVYSYFVWRDADDKTPPANTLPADDLA